MSEAINMTMAAAMKVANDENLVAFFAKPRELLMDFDEPFEVAVIKVQSKIRENAVLTGILRKGGIHFDSQLWTRSKSGNAHLYVHTTEELTDAERICLQAIYGSDPSREMFNLMRLMSKGDFESNEIGYNVALFETKDQAVEIVKWRAANHIRVLKAKLQAARQAEADRVDSEIWDKAFESNGY